MQAFRSPSHNSVALRRRCHDEATSALETGGGSRCANARQCTRIRGLCMNASANTCRSGWPCSHRKHSRVVAWSPVPNATPGVRTTLMAAGSGASDQSGTIHSALPLPAPARHQWVATSISERAAGECFIRYNGSTYRSATRHLQLLSCYSCRVKHRNSVSR